MGQHSEPESLCVKKAKGINKKQTQTQNALLQPHLSLSLSIYRPVSQHCSMKASGSIFSTVVE